MLRIFDSFFRAIEKKPKEFDAEVYVRNRQTVTPTEDEMFDIMLVLNTYGRRALGVEPPSDPCITPAQYQRLPDNLKAFFVKKTIRLKVL